MAQIRFDGFPPFAVDGGILGGRWREQARPSCRIVPQLKDPRQFVEAAGQQRADPAYTNVFLVNRLDPQAGHVSDLSIVASN